MKEKIKSKKTILIFGVALLALVGITFAYFGTSDSFPNVFRTQKYSSKAKETFTSPVDWAPGDRTPKNLIVTNTGTMCENVRVYYTENWTSKNGDTLPNVQYGKPLAVINTTNHEDWVQDGNYWYYNKNLAPNESTSSFIDSVSYSKTVTNDYECTDDGNGQRTCSSSGDGYDGATYTLTIHIETIQCNLAEETWEVDYDDMARTIATFDLGVSVNNKMRLLEDPNASSLVPNTTLKRFIKADELPSGFTASSGNTLSSSTSAVPIYGWNTGDTIYWYTEADVVYLNLDASHMFESFKALEDIDSLSDVQTSNTVLLNNMFNNTSNLSDISALSLWNTANVTNMSRLFNNDEYGSLTDISALNGWETGNVTNMQYLFRRQDLLTINSMKHWDFSKCIVTDGMFVHNFRLSDIRAAANWDVSSVSNMYHMFEGCFSLTDISPLEDWDTSNCQDMGNLFKLCIHLTDLSPIADWDVSSNEKFGFMFGVEYSQLPAEYYGVKMDLADLTPLADWNVSSGKSFYSMFRGCVKLTTLSGLGTWNVSGAVFSGENSCFQNMFDGCTGLTDASAINSWAVGSVSYTANTLAGNPFYLMFQGCSVHPTFTNRAGTWDANGSLIPS